PGLPSKPGTHTWNGTQTSIGFEACQIGRKFISHLPILAPALHPPRSDSRRSDGEVRGIGPARPSAPAQGSARRGASRATPLLAPLAGRSPQLHRRGPDRLLAECTIHGGGQPDHGLPARALPIHLLALQDLGSHARVRLPLALS